MSGPGGAQRARARLARRAGDGAPGGSDIADPDLAWAAALAGRLALAAGQRARARAALRTAADQHRRLGKEREASEIEAELADAVEPAGAD